MPTLKKRINVTVSEDLEAALEQLATRDHVPVATKAMELLRSAIEMDEDEVWDALMKKRDTKKAKYLSHEEAWA